MKISFRHLCFLIFPSVSFAQTWSEAKKDDIVIVTNKGGGQTLGYSATSGIKIVTVDGFAFKDLNKNDKLDKYEDWRLPADDRARDLAFKMTIEQIAGLMLYSNTSPFPQHLPGPLPEHTTGKNLLKAVLRHPIFPINKKIFLLKIM
ncbi:MAG: hypothetical protein ABJA71_11895 [Ginsengibacter sp.]